MSSARDGLREATAPSRPPAPPRPARVDSLDGLRTIAVMLVVAFHVGAPGLSGGYLGVDVFFVLSGFLITTLLIKELAARGRIDLARFWTRRFLRLMPAALLVILTVVVWGLVAAPPFRRPALGADALWSLLYVGNWRFIGSASYFEDDGTTSPLLHVWSLAVEEQFYLLWPVLLTVVGALVWQKVRVDDVVDSASRIEAERLRRYRIAHAVGLTAAVVGLISALLLWLLYDPAAPERAYMGTDTKVFEPLVGALAAAVMTRSRVQRWVVEHCAPLVGIGLAGIAVGVATLGGPSPAYFRGGAVAFSIACAVLVAAATAGGNLGLVERTLGWGPVAYVGRISYGVYLWHWPVALWILGDTHHFRPGKALLAVALTVALAAASYHLLEVPIRTGRLTRVPPLRLAPLGAASLALVVAVSTFLGGTGLSRLNPFAAAVSSPGGDTVLVVGDSVMRRLVPTLAEKAAARGVTVLDGARGGCPALTVPALDVDGSLLADGACTEQVRRAQDEVVDAHSPRIVLWWSRYELADRQGDDGSVLRAGTPEFWTAQRASFEADAARLTRDGATLVVVLTDRPGIGLGSRCTPEKCHAFLDRIWHQDELRRTWNDLVREVAADDPRIRPIVIDDVYCRDDAVPCDDHLPLVGGGPAPTGTPSPPTERNAVGRDELDGLARPDGSHFGPEAMPGVADTLLDRVLQATSR